MFNKLKYETNDDKIIIAFPLKVAHIFFDVFVLFASLFTGAWFLAEMLNNIEYYLVGLFILCVAIFIAAICNLILLFKRKLIYDNSNNSFKYCTFRRRQFSLSEIMQINNSEQFGISFPYASALIPNICGLELVLNKGDKSKSITIRTNSELQRKELGDYFLSLNSKINLY